MLNCFGFVNFWQTETVTIWSMNWWNWRATYLFVLEMVFFFLDSEFCVGSWFIDALFYSNLQARILALNASYFLKNGGHFVISIKVCTPVRTHAWFTTIFFKLLFFFHADTHTLTRTRTIRCPCVGPTDYLLGEW